MKPVNLKSSEQPAGSSRIWGVGSVLFRKFSWSEPFSGSLACQKMPLSCHYCLYKLRRRWLVNLVSFIDFLKVLCCLLPGVKTFAFEMECSTFPLKSYILRSFPSKIKGFNLGEIITQYISTPPTHTHTHRAYMYMQPRILRVTRH